MDREIAIGEENMRELRLGLVRIPVALNETNESETFWMCPSAKMAIYAIAMTKLEVDSNLVIFSEIDLFTKNAFHKILNSSNFIVFHYFLEGDVNVACYTTTNALFNAEIKMLQMLYFL